MHHLNEIFRKLAHIVSGLTGSAPAFLLATTVVIVWAVMGPIFNFSDTWQLVINTATTIVTFLMVFLIQNTQNRDSQAIHTKLDELLVATQGARNSIAIAEELSDEELNEERQHFEDVARAAAEVTGQGNGASTEKSSKAAPGRDARPASPSTGSNGRSGTR